MFKVCKPQPNNNNNNKLKRKLVGNNGGGGGGGGGGGKVSASPSRGAAATTAAGRQLENKENFSFFFKGNSKKKSKVVEKTPTATGTGSKALPASPILKKGSLVNTRYRIIKLIGSGSFGEVYSAIDELNNGLEVALKIEKPSKLSYGLLRIERIVYDDIKGGIGIPDILYYGKDSVTKYPILVMDLLGQSLEDLLKKCGGKFSVNTTAMLADQMIERVEALHSRNYIHRDIKPENFLLGSKNGKKNRNTQYYWTKTAGEELYLIDYGLARKYRDSKFKHISFQSSYGSVTGTVRYTSVHSHLGNELSRRDDLLSIGYVLIYFLKGRLPWQGLPADSKLQKHQKIGQVKMETSVEDLCKGLPHEYTAYMEYCNLLQFEEVPDYMFLRSLFRKQISSNKAAHDLLVYDWNQIARKSDTSSVQVRSL